VEVIPAAHLQVQDIPLPDSSKAILPLSDMPSFYWTTVVGEMSAEESEEGSEEEEEGNDPRPQTIPTDPTTIDYTDTDMRTAPTQTDLTEVLTPTIPLEGTSVETLR
jgi:hypothetical protein